MLFQGQEFAASSPFLFFADLPPELAKLTRAGRAEFLAQFPSLAGAEAQAALADPASRLTFERSKLDLTERERHAAAYSLHVDLLRLRREDPVFRTQGAGGVDGAVLGPEALALRFFDPGPDPHDRLLCLNLGRDLTLPAIAEPLLAPPEGGRAGPFSGPARPSATAAPARPSSTRPRAGSCPAMPPSSSAPRDDRSDPAHRMARPRPCRSGVRSGPANGS